MNSSSNQAKCTDVSLPQFYPATKIVFFLSSLILFQNKMGHTSKGMTHL